MLKNRLLRCFAVVVSLITVTHFLSCGMKKMLDPLSALNFRISEMSALHDDTGAERSSYYTGESLYLTLDQLYPSWQTQIRVFKISGDLTGDTVISTILVMSDTLGRVNHQILWPNIGISNRGLIIDPSGDYTVHILQAVPDKPWINFKVQFHVYGSFPPHPYINARRSDGTFLGSGVLLGRDMYVQGGSFAAALPVRLTIVQDKASYGVGDLLVDISGGAEPITTSSAGELPLTKAWSAVTTIGIYDLVADTEPFGQFNIGDAVNQFATPGLLVQNDSTYHDILLDLACDALGNYKNSFSDIEDVYCRAHPPIRPRGLSVGTGNLLSCAIYICPHQSLWFDGDPLVQIQGTGGMISATKSKMDVSSGSLALTMVRSSHGAADKTQLLFPGDYDMIVDINNNAVYDPGIDLLDGGLRSGFGVAGVPPDVRMSFYTMPDLKMAGKTPVRAALVRGDGMAISGVLVTFCVLEGDASLAATSVTTDADGIANSAYAGVIQGRWAKIAATAVVDGSAYERTILVWGDLTYTHNQGVIFGN